MKYNVTSFTVKSGTKITLIMNNTATSPAMKHNIVILKDASKKAIIAHEALTATNYLPNNPDILAATPLAGAGEKTEITFTTPEPGNYMYICTFPGHSALMYGTMIVE